MGPGPGLGEFVHRVRDLSTRIREGLQQVRAPSLGNLGRRVRARDLDRRTVWSSVLVVVILLEAGAVLAYRSLDDRRATPGDTSAGDARDRERNGELAISKAFDDGRSPGSTSTEPTRGRGQGSPWGPLEENAEGGYRFGVPPGWSVDREGTTTEVASPEGDTVVSFGLSFAGPLQAASESLVRLLDRSYNEIRISKRREMTIDDRQAVVFQGSAVNDSGVSIGFRLYTVQAKPRNFAVGVFQRAALTWREGDADDVARTFRVDASD